MVIRRKSTNSLSLKKPRTPASAYVHAATAKNIVLIIIAIITLIVCAAIVASFLLQPERQVHQKIEALASNYYENVFYERMLNSDQFTGNPEEALKSQSTRGLAIITLRQLLLQDDATTANDTDYLLKYCDENNTTVRFYPEAPYTRASYRTEYTYACNF